LIKQVICYLIFKFIE